MSPSVVVGSTVRWPVPRAVAARAAATVLRGEDAAGATVSLAFVGARRIRSLNKAYFGKDRPTDVIAFGYGAPGRRGGGSSRRSSGAAVVGDVYVCPEVAARNARQFGVTPRQELLRLIVHGVLHVLGYDHPEGDARMHSAMWRAQERYLARLAGRRTR